MQQKFHQQKPCSDGWAAEFRPDSRPLTKLELDPEITEEPEVVLKSKVPYERKKLDLSIFTFDETPIENLLKKNFIWRITKFI